MDTSLTLGCAVPQDFCHALQTLTADSPSYPLSDADFSAKLRDLQQKATHTTLTLAEIGLLDLMQVLRPNLA